MASIRPRRNKAGRIVSFLVRIYCGRVDGRPVLENLTFSDFPKDYKSEQKITEQARKWAILQEAIKTGGVVTPPSNMTFRDYCELCLARDELNGLKHSTIVRWKEMTERIYAVIGDKKLLEINQFQLNNFYTSLRLPGTNKRTGGGLAAKTITEHHRLIHRILARAVREGYIERNPADLVEKIKNKKTKEITYYQPDEVIAILKALDKEILDAQQKDSQIDHEVDDSASKSLRSRDNNYYTWVAIKWKTIFYLLLLTGIRRGELCGLKWSAIHLDDEYMEIYNNVLYTDKETGIYEDEPKTDGSRRFIKLRKELIQQLKQYKLWQQKQIHCLGDAVNDLYRDNDYVFTQFDGSPMHPDSITDRCSNFAKKHVLMHINPHAFRHTFASMMIYQGEDIVRVSEMLGHSNPSTTLNIYSHVIKEQKFKTRDIYAEIFNAL